MSEAINILCSYPDGETTSLGYVIPPDPYVISIGALWEEFMGIEYDTNDEFIPFLVRNYGFTVCKFDNIDHVTVHSS